MTGDERTMLTVWLDYQRATLLWKCEGVSGPDLARKGIPPSNLSLLGLLRHMTSVEWSWLQNVFSGDPAPAPFSTDEDADADFNDLRPDGVDEDMARFLRQCEVSRAIVAGAESLDQEAANFRSAVSLRWIMVHMIEEYARHNGHADLLRELIDGAVGE
jgi:Protein of unknown function (DUF664)